MRESILTKNERDAIEKFLKDGESSNMIRVLRYRAKRFLPVLGEEMALLEQFLRT